MIKKIKHTNKNSLQNELKKTDRTNLSGNGARAMRGLVSEREKPKKFDQCVKSIEISKIEELGTLIKKNNERKEQTLTER